MGVQLGHRLPVSVYLSSSGVIPVPEDWMKILRVRSLQTVSLSTTRKRRGAHEFTVMERSLSREKAPSCERCVDGAEGRVGRSGPLFFEFAIIVKSSDWHIEAAMNPALHRDKCIRSNRLVSL